MTRRPNDSCWTSGRLFNLGAGPIGLTLHVFQAGGFRARAEARRAQAKSAKDAAGRDLWLKLADQWARMAEAEAMRRRTTGSRSQTKQGWRAS